MERVGTRPNRPKSRQSIANVTSSKELEFDKENVTADPSSMRKRKLTGTEAERKKLRSKSLGPGGLDALKESPGNRTKVVYYILWSGTMIQLAQ
jgi:kinetochore protein Spc7/SPC105